jgi:hypothetical protein
MRIFLGIVLILACANFPQASEISASLRPVLRPEQAVDPVVPAGTTLRQSLRPLARPKSIETAAVKRATQLAKGSVCGDSAIQGEYVGRVAAKTNGCGLSDAVKLSSVSGVKLSQKAVMDCTTAKALKKWIETGAKPVIGNQGGGLASLQIMGHYSCRPRNNQRGAKISEHGRGRAIDIGAFTLKNGVSFSVLRDWNRSKWSDELSKMHRAACGLFGTVLGPRANKYHQDHFHFDTARYCSGSYCK